MADVKYVNVILKVRVDETRLRDNAINGDRPLDELIFGEMAWVNDSGIYTDEVNIEF